MRPSVPVEPGTVPEVWEGTFGTISLGCEQKKPFKKVEQLQELKSSNPLSLLYLMGWDIFAKKPGEGFVENKLISTERWVKKAFRQEEALPFFKCQGAGKHPCPFPLRGSIFLP